MRSAATVRCRREPRIRRHTGDIAHRVAAKEAGYRPEMWERDGRRLMADAKWPSGDQRQWQRADGRRRKKTRCQGAES